MNRIRFKLAALAAAVTLVLALTSARGDKRILARYKQSNTGSTCQPATQLPETCTPEATGTICTTPFGSFTRTWYQDICVTPYYKAAE